MRQPPMMGQHLRLVLNPLRPTDRASDTNFRAQAVAWALVLVVFPSSSSLNGHPARPGKRVAGGGGRPEARGPGRGPAGIAGVAGIGGGNGYRG